MDTSFFPVGLWRCYQLINIKSITFPKIFQMCGHMNVFISLPLDSRSRLCCGNWHIFMCVCQKKSSNHMLYMEMVLVIELLGSTSASKALKVTTQQFSTQQQIIFICVRILTFKWKNNYFYALFICATRTRGHYRWDKVECPLWTQRPLRDNLWIFRGTCKLSWCKVPSGIIHFTLNPAQHNFSLWRLWEPGC